MRLEWRPLRPGELDHETLWASVAAFLAVALVLWIRLVEWPPVTCPFHALTGFPCLTCGATRAVFALLEARVLDALRLNPLVAGTLLVATPYVAYAAVVSLFRLPRLRVRLEAAHRRMLRAAAWAGLAATWAFLIADGR